MTIKQPEERAAEGRQETSGETRADLPKCETSTWADAANADAWLKVMQ